MLVHMRTTVRLDEALMRQVKAEAARRGQTVTELIEKGLQLVLANGRGRTRRERVVVPVSRASGGTHPGVELDDSSALLDRLDGRP
jgi:hypothetical protein